MAGIVITWSSLSLGATKGSFTWNFCRLRTTNLSWVSTALPSTTSQRSSTTTPATSCQSRGLNTCPCSTQSLRSPPIAWPQNSDLHWRTQQPGARGVHEDPRLGGPFVVYMPLLHGAGRIHLRLEAEVCGSKNGCIVCSIFANSTTSCMLDSKAFFKGARSSFSM